MEPDPALLCKSLPLMRHVTLAECSVASRPKSMACHAICADSSQADNRPHTITYGMYQHQLMVFPNSLECGTSFVNVAILTPCVTCARACILARHRKFSNYDTNNCLLRAPVPCRPEVKISTRQTAWHTHCCSAGAD